MKAEIREVTKEGFGKNLKEKEEDYMGTAEIRVDTTEALHMYSAKETSYRIAKLEITINLPVSLPLRSTDEFQKMLVENLTKTIGEQLMKEEA